MNEKHHKHTPTKECHKCGRYNILSLYLLKQYLKVGALGYGLVVKNVDPNITSSESLS